MPRLKTKFWDNSTNEEFNELLDKQEQERINLIEQLKKPTTSVPDDFSFFLKNSISVINN